MVEGGVEVVTHTGVRAVGEVSGRLGEVVEGRRGGAGIAHPKAQTEVGAKEVGVVDAGAKAQPQRVVALRGAAGHSLQATADVDSYIVAVAGLLRLGSTGQRGCRHKYH